MQQLRLPGERVFLFGSVVLIALLCVFISVTHFTDRVLFVLICPIIFSALFYSRWLYVTLIISGTVGTFIARVFVAPQQTVALQDMLLMTLLMIGVAEMLHRLMRRMHRNNEIFHATLKRSQLLVDQSPAGLYHLNLDGTLLECNQAMAHLFGYDTREQVLGQSAKMFYLDDDAWLRCVAQVLQHGTSAATELRMRRRDGTLMWVLKQSTRVDDAQGAPTGVVGTLTDITERKRAEDRQRFLADARALLAASLDYEHTLRQVATLAVSCFADWCTIVLRRRDGSLHRIALVCADPANQWLADGLRQYPVRADAAHMFPYIMQTGEAEFLPELPADYFTTAAVDAHHLALLHQIGARSMITVPMMTRGQILGSLTLTIAESGRRYDAADLDVAKDLARHAVQALDTGYLYNDAQRRLAELTTVQQVARAINSSLQLADVFQVVVSQISVAFGYRMVSSYLLQDEVLHLQAAIGYNSKLSTIPISQGVSGRVVRSGQAVFTRNASHEPDFLFAMPGIVQSIIVPLKRGERVLGMLAVETDGTPLLADEDYALLTLLADQVSIAVANAQLFTDLHASEQRYRASEERYRLLADHSLDLVELLDLEGNLRYASPSHQQVLGYTPDDLIKENLFALLHSDDRRALLSVVQQVQQRDVSQIVELRVLHKRGNWVIVEALLSAIVDGTDAMHVLLSAREITERKQAEEARRQLEYKMLETQKLESLGVLAGGIAHDFNNLLTAMIGYAELALLELEPQTPAYQAVREGHYVMQRAVDLTRQLLAYAGRGQFVVAPVDINTLIYEMITLFKTSIVKTARVQYELFPQALLISADATQMRQVIMNLVMNAAEALPHGQGTVTIRTSVRRLAPEALPLAVLTAAQPQYLCLEIADTGRGMDAETQAKIFEPFFTTKSTGHGLGLAAVLGIIRDHGGFLNVESTLGVGTTFTILLPLLEKELHAVSANTDPQLQACEVSSTTSIARCVMRDA